MCFLPQSPFTQNLTRSGVIFLRQGESAAPKGVGLPKVSRLHQGGGSLAPPRDPRRKREAGAVQPGNRSQSCLEGTRLGNGNSTQRSQDRHLGMSTKREKPTLTQIWDPTLELQTQERESSKEENANNATRSHSGGRPASGRKARPFRFLLPWKVEWRSPA